MSVHIYQIIIVHRRLYTNKNVVKPLQSILHVPFSGPTLTNRPPHPPISSMTAP